MKQTFETEQTFEKELENSFTIEELEERFEMAMAEGFCCDFDPSKGHDHSCGKGF